MWDTGDSDGEWNLGVAYESGKFGKVDAVKALKHYRKAADGDDANALGRLGYAYEQVGAGGGRREGARVLHEGCGRW